MFHGVHISDTFPWLERLFYLNFWGNSSTPNCLFFSATWKIFIQFCCIVSDVLNVQHRNKGHGPLIRTTLLFERILLLIIFVFLRFSSAESIRVPRYGWWNTCAVWRVQTRSVRQSGGQLSIPFTLARVDCNTVRIFVWLGPSWRTNCSVYVKEVWVHVNAAMLERDDSRYRHFAPRKYPCVCFCFCFALFVCLFVCMFFFCNLNWTNFLE